MKRRGICLALALWTAGCGTGLAAGGTGPTDLASYQRALHAVRVSLDGLTKSGRVSKLDLQRITQQLRSIDQVRLPDGRVNSTGSSDLASVLSSGRMQDALAVAAEVDAEDEALQSIRTREVSPSDLTQLDLVLRDPRFQARGSLGEVIGAWLTNRVSDLVQIMQGGLSALTGSLLPALIFLGVLTVLAVLAARRAASGLVVDARRASPEAEPLTSREAAESVASHVARSEYRMALRYLFLQTMLSMQEAGALELQPGMTNREYLVRLETMSVRSAMDRHALEELVNVFDRSWYGHAPVGADDFGRAQSLARRVLGSLAGRGAA